MTKEKMKLKADKESAEKWLEATLRKAEKGAERRRQVRAYFAESGFRIKKTYN